MRSSVLALTLACLTALGTGHAHAQSASDALRAAWQQICPDATPGSELFARCAEIRDSGAGAADRELAAANGNNLELLATQGRMLMATVKQRARRTQRQARNGSSAASLAWSPWLAAADDSSDSSDDDPGSRWALIASAGTGRSERGESSLERAYGSDNRFLLLGLDYRFSERVQGVFAIQRENSESRFARGTGAMKSETRAYSAALNYTLSDAWQLQASVSRGDIDSVLTRSIDYTLIRNAGTPQQDSLRIQSEASSRNRGQMRAADLSLDWQHGWQGFTVRAGAALAWQRTQLDAVSEDNPKGLDFQIAAQEIDSRQATINLEAARSVSFSAGVWQPFARIGWSHEFADDVRRINARFRSGNQVFAAQFLTSAPDRSSGQLMLGSAFVFTHGWQAYGTWQQMFGHEFIDDRRFDIGLRKEF